MAENSPFFEPLKPGHRSVATERVDSQSFEAASLLVEIENLWAVAVAAVVDSILRFAEHQTGVEQAMVEGIVGNLPEIQSHNQLAVFAVD